MDTLNALLQTLNDIFQRGALGLTYGEIALALAIVLASIFIRNVFAKRIVHYLIRLTGKTDTLLDDTLINAIAAPLKIIPVIVGIFAALHIIDIEGQPAIIAENILRSVVTLAVFWTFARIVKAFEFTLTGVREKFSPAIVDWMVQLVQVLLVVIGFGAVAEIWGISVAPLIASLGIFGIAIGLAAQDLFKNLIGGLLILGEKRFVPGDWIKIDGLVEGTVERINFRSTLVRRFDKSPVFVPNAKLADGAVTNFSRMTHRRIKWLVGVEYRTSVAQLRYIRDEIEAWLWHDERFAKPPHVPLFVRIDAFSDSSIDFLIYTFTNTTDWGQWLKIKEEMAVEIFKIIEKAGTSFAFPSRTIYMQEQDAPDILAPPAPSAGVAAARKALDPSQ